MSAEREIQLITVSREFGAGGGELAAELGRRLDWPVVDRDIVHRVAERLRLDDGTVTRFDEHAPSLLARIACVLVTPQPETHSFPLTDSPSHDAIAEATRGVIQELGASTPVVIVGHGAQCIFARRADALHVRLIAPLASRIERVMRRMTCDAAAARSLIHRADRDREEYVRRYFHCDWRSDQLYDLQINTGTIPIEEAATLIERIARAPAWERSVEKIAEVEHRFTREDIRE